MPVIWKYHKANRETIIAKLWHGEKPIPRLTEHRSLANAHSKET